MIHPATCFLRGLFTCTGVNLIRNTATRGLGITFFLSFYFEGEIRKARDVNRQSYSDPNLVSVIQVFFISPKIDLKKGQNREP